MLQDYRRRLRYLRYPAHWETLPIRDDLVIMEHCRRQLPRWQRSSDFWDILKVTSCELPDANDPVP